MRHRLHRLLAMLGRVGLASVFAALVLSAQTTDTGWPREIAGPQATIVVYEPQPDSLVGDRLFGRAATSVTLKGAKEPEFGALWFTAELDVDRDARTATVLSADVTRIKFPDADTTQLQAYESAIEDAVPKWNVVLSLDRLTTTLAAAEQDRPVTRASRPMRRASSSPRRLRC